MKRSFPLSLLSAAAAALLSLIARGSAQTSAASADANLLTNGSFAAGIEPWNITSHGKQKADPKIVPGPQKGMSALSVTATADPGLKKYHVDVAQALKRGLAAKEKLQIHFQARSPEGNVIAVMLQQAVPLKRAFYREVRLTPEWKSYKIEVTANAPLAESGVNFKFFTAFAPGTVELADLQLVAVQAQTASNPLAALGLEQSRWKRPAPFVTNAPKDPLVGENSFIDREPNRSYPKNFPESVPHLPKPWWDGHQPVIDGYWRAWELAFRNCRRAPLETGFVAPFIDTAFNDCIFMWDSVFILMFARYGERAFPFQGTLDNFYAKQHPSGFICREIKEWDGADRFHYADPNSTGPNLFPWSEWECFQQFGDRERLAEVFPPLLALYHWFRKNRTWPDGTYWSTGWSNGMDNQPRVSPGAGLTNEHDHMSWIDTTAQAVFSAKILVKMAAALGREADVADLQPEIDMLTAFVNERMWNEEIGFYVDRRRDGSLSNVKSIAGFWPLLAGLATPEREARLRGHLTDPKTFGRPHPIPSLAADDSHYNGEKGKYWCGSVWPPTNYMVLRGLTASGDDKLAHTLGRRHVEVVTKVYQDTNTYWENYASDQPKQGEPAHKDFLGWGGVGPIAVLLEYVFGLRPDSSRDLLVWDVRLTEAYGVKDYPFGSDTTIELAVGARARDTDEPVVTVKSNRPVKIELRWPGGGKRVINVDPATR